MQIDCVGFTVIIDDIVLPDGTTCMAQLGGGGPQTLFGFQLISKCLGHTRRIGLAAGVGADLPGQCKEWLAGIGCNTNGLGDLPTPRAWQLFEYDGRRTQVWRVTECDELYQQLRPNFHQLPERFQQSCNYHLGIHASHPPMKLLRALRQAAHRHGGKLSVEPYTACDSQLTKDQLTALLQSTDIFSPNEAEAASIVGPGSPEQLLQRLLVAGASTVVLRQGPQGVLIGHSSTQRMWQVPAVPGTQVVDVTGCGNAFCGGFLAAQHAGLDLQDSGRWGCVAGSIMAEWQGVPPASQLEQLVVIAQQKCQLLCTAATTLASLQTSSQHSTSAGDSQPIDAVSFCSSSSSNAVNSTGSVAAAAYLKSRATTPKSSSSCLAAAGATNKKCICARTMHNMRVRAEHKIVQRAMVPPHGVAKCKCTLARRLTPMVLSCLGRLAVAGCQRQLAQL